MALRFGAYVRAILLSLNRGTRPPNGGTLVSPVGIEPTTESPQHRPCGLARAIDDRRLSFQAVNALFACVTPVSLQVRDIPVTTHAPSDELGDWQRRGQVNVSLSPCALALTCPLAFCGNDYPRAYDHWSTPLRAEVLGLWFGDAGASNSVLAYSQNCVTFLPIA